MGYSPCTDKELDMTERLTVLSHFSSVGLFATLWAVACHAPLFMEFSRQEYWSRLPFPSLRVTLVILEIGLLRLA